MNLVLDPAAADELDAAAEWYERDYPGRGVRFVAAVEQRLERVVDAPRSFPFFGSSGGPRRAVLSRFPYVIVFVMPNEATVRVVAFAHAKRQPGYWGRRETR